MSFLDRLFGRPEKRAAVSAEPVLPDLWFPRGPGNPENLATVLACVNAISSGIASLDAYVYNTAGNTRTEAPNHPVSRLIRQPNRTQTWPDLMEWALASVLLTGNAVMVVEYDGAGRPTALTPIPWQCVQVDRLKSGRLRYTVMAWQGVTRTLLDNEVFHLRDRSDDGLVGRSRLSRARDVFTGAAALQDYSLNMWQNQVVPSGIVSSETGALSNDQAKDLKQQLQERAGGTNNARRVIVLPNGLKWQAVGISPEDAEALESRKFSVQELCRIYGVPPPIVQDYSNNTFTNAAQASLWFAQNTLVPWVRKIEAEFKRSVFGASNPYELVIDMSSLMRGDYATRWQSYGVAIQNKILTVNEIREQEGYNPMQEDAA
ncbi:phage portal protein [Acetobacter tropicalis]|uniref:Phage portal protein n=1 Tax=Acetobacter tropicalis TaxID=104102 RepID=A0A095AXE7_9PROT|nr:phage portal protein [Acetobacter tropicalis]KAA8389611.1 phage portal protein [Acetobacter tropicalis]KAA8390467.1 phage portal protein [Acetobacter tropicalis]KGB21423.1 Phage portal protein [Acetobacter tropicalis]MBC9008456.1 phage portal protein [Acetobacter tropicalis]MDO8173306.1 phage portal protein [Acetobacter tropicalis]